MAPPAVHAMGLMLSVAGVSASAPESRVSPVDRSRKIAAAIPCIIGRRIIVSLYLVMSRRLALIRVPPLLMTPLTIPRIRVSCLCPQVVVVTVLWLI